MEATPARDSVGRVASAELPVRAGTAASALVGVATPEALAASEVAGGWRTPAPRPSSGLPLTSEATSPVAELVGAAARAVSAPAALVLPAMKGSCEWIPRGATVETAMGATAAPAA